MKKLLTIIAASSLLALSVPVFAQNVEEDVLPVDQTEGNVDSSLVSRTVYEVMPENVILQQSPKVRSALANHISANGRKKYNGYRVRIYLGSNQSARDASLHALNTFQRLYPDIPSYRVYESPNFRVLVGNFRTRYEADRFAEAVRHDFPTASVVRDRFKYPSIGRPDFVPRDTTEAASLPVLKLD